MVEDITQNVDELSQKTVELAKQFDFLGDGHSSDAVVSAILTVLTWHIAEYVESDLFIDHLATQLKIAVNIQKQRNETH